MASASSAGVNLLACERPRLSSLDQPQRQAQIRAQLFFAPRHLSIVALVIVAAQMQNAVQHQNLDFLGRRVAQGGAFFVAISAEMAISPAKFSARRARQGNESTSVGLFFPRKRRFRDFISALEVSSTLTVPFSPAARRARARSGEAHSSVRDTLSKMTDRYLAVI